MNFYKKEVRKIFLQYRNYLLKSDNPKLLVIPTDFDINEKDVKLNSVSNK